MLVNGTDHKVAPVDEAGLVKAQPYTVVAPAHATAVQPIPAPRKSAHSSTSSYSNAGLYY